MTDSLHREFQAWLDRWADLILADDHEAFYEYLVMPFSVTLGDATWSVSTYEESEAGFDAYRNDIVTQGVDLVVRILRDVERISDTEVNLIYENYLMKGSMRAFRPSWAKANLIHDRNGWRATGVISREMDEPAQTHLPNIHAKQIYDSVSHAQINMTPPENSGEGVSGND